MLGTYADETNNAGPFGLLDAERQTVREQCADEHNADLATVRIVRTERFHRPYEKGRNIGEVELRYVHKGLASDLDGWLIEPGRVCGALYGIYRSEANADKAPNVSGPLTFSCFAD